MRQSDVYVLLPVLYRPHQLKRVLDSLRNTAPEIGIVVAIEADDKLDEGIALQHGAIVTVCPKPRDGCANAWNTALRATPGTAQAFVLGADDLIFKPGWYEETIKVLDEELHGSGLVGFNDELKNFWWSTHYLMTRDFLIEHNGGVMAIPYYKTYFVDVETCARAKRAGKFAKAPKAHVRHEWNGLHPDRNYVSYRAHLPEATKFHEEREKAGYPDDFEAVLK